MVVGSGRRGTSFIHDRGCCMLFFQCEELKSSLRWRYLSLFTAFVILMPVTVFFMIAAKPGDGAKVDKFVISPDPLVKGGKITINFTISFCTSTYSMSFMDRPT